MPCNQVEQIALFIVTAIDITDVPVVSSKHPSYEKKDNKCSLSVDWVELRFVLLCLHIYQVHLHSIIKRR
jgi:hypothetical protein